MKIPDTVRIGLITYKVEIHDEPLEGDRIGEIDYHNATIKLSKFTAEDVQKWTFYHELTHALFMKLGYHGDDKITLDERFVDAFGCALGELVDDLIK